MQSGLQPAHAARSSRVLRIGAFSVLLLLGSFIGYLAGSARAEVRKPAGGVWSGGQPLAASAVPSLGVLGAGRAGYQTGPDLASVTLYASSVTGGVSVTGYVSLTAPAPPGGISVSMSSDRGAASVPTTVNVTSGYSYAYFTVTTTPVSAQILATISGSYQGTTKTAALTLLPPQPYYLSLNPNSVIGGSTSTGTVTLTGPAPAGGLSVSLSSSNGAAQVPATTVVSAGQSSGTFIVTTSAVASPVQATIGASANGSTVNATLTVLPVPALASLALNPATVTGGAYVTGTVTLTSPAPANGVTVSLSSDSASATPPASVTVYGGNTSSNFSIATQPVIAVTTASLSASYNGVTKTAALTINPAALSGLTVYPNPITGGNQANGTVLLTGPAPPAGITVSLASNNVAASVPASVTVTAGSSFAYFTVNTTPVAVTTTATLTATYSSTAKTAALTVAQPYVYGLSLAAYSVIGGTSTAGTITLTGPAAAGGFAVSLSSSNAAATVPATVTIPAGQSRADFTIATTAVSVQTQATLTASAGGRSVTATLTILPVPTLVSVVVNPTSVTGGAWVNGTVTLSTPAPSGGVTVALGSDQDAAPVPASVTVFGGSTTGSFSISTRPVAAVVAATITATYNGASQSATLTVNPPVLQSLSVNPGTVGGGDSAMGSVALSGPAPAGGLSVALASDNAAASVPISVTLPEGSSYANFTVETTPVGQDTAAGISATLNNVTKTASLAITTVKLQSLSLYYSSVTGGSNVQGTVTLTGPAPPGGSRVTLQSDNPAAAVGSGVVVPAGQRSAYFFVYTSAVSVRTVATITGTYNGLSKSAQLTIVPSALLQLSVAPAQVVGGATATGTVILNGFAPSGGAVVALSSNNSAATVPASVTVPSGSTIATFPVATSTVAAVTNVTITGTYGGSSQTAPLTVLPAASLLSITLNPSTVPGGGFSSGTVTLSAPAPSGGAVVTLSSDQAAAIPPATVTVSSGATTGYFTVSTKAVAAVTVAMIGATLNGVTKTAALTITPPALLGLSLNPSSVVGGNMSTGTVSLASAAPDGGLTVMLSSDNPVASVPATVTVPGGYFSSSFPINTTAVAGQVVATISASASGVTKTAALTVGPLLLLSLKVDPPVIAGGGTATGTVQLTGSAPSGGVVVSLTSDNAVAPVPPAVYVPGGFDRADFPIPTDFVATPVTATISASYAAVTKTAPLTVSPIAPLSLSLYPSAVPGGTASTGTVTLNGPAPAGGLIVALSSDNTAASPPQTVTVPAGLTSARFPIATTPVGSTVIATISAAANGVTVRAPLTINSPGLFSLSVNPGTVVGGNPATGAVTLNAPAGSGGATVSLSSSRAEATVPVSVTVPAGQSSASFPVNTMAVPAVVYAAITGTYAGASRNAPLTILPPTVLSQLSIYPGQVNGGSSATATVYLSGPAPAGGAPVTITSDNGAAVVPSTVTVPAGANNASFTITTTGVASRVTATITASYGGNSRSATLTILPPTPLQLTLNPAVVTGGNPSTATLTLTYAAPAGGLTVVLSSNSAAATVPATVTVPGGAISASFTVNTTVVSSVTYAQLQASANGGSAFATLTIQPALTLFSLSVSPSRVSGGQNASGTVTLTAAAPVGGAAVTLLSDNGTAIVPATVTVPAGYTSAGFTIRTTPVTARTVANLTASYAGASKTATLTVLPPGPIKVTLNPPNVLGGNSSTGTVTLNAAAPAGGIVVTLGSSNPAATVPASVTVAAGGTSADFPITTVAVRFGTASRISAAVGDISASALLGILPPATLAGFTIVPPEVTGGTTAIGTLGLSSAAPPGGVLITLSSDSPAAQPPVSVLVPSGETIATFNIPTSAVAVVTTANISATLNDVTLTSALQIDPPVLFAVRVDPSTVSGGDPATGAVALTGPAPAGGVVVTLSSDNLAAIVPASVTVPEGYTGMNFRIDTLPVNSPVTAGISGTLNDITRSAALTINPLVLFSLSLYPTTLYGGSAAQGAVTLSGLAPAGGAVISLSSDNPAAQPPLSVTIPQGKRRATFWVNTARVATAVKALVSGAYGGVTRSVALQILPGAALIGLTVTPDTVNGGNSATGTLTLSAPASPGGVTVTLTADNPAIQVPQQVTLYEGYVTSSFRIDTSAVPAVTQGTITATLGGVSKSAPLTVLPPSLQRLLATPSAVVGGDTAAGYVYLTAPAPAGGITVALASDNPAATVPGSVIVPAGQSATSFVISTSPVRAPAVATISGTYNGVTRFAPLAVIRSSAYLLSLSLNPNTLLGGSTSAGTVRLNMPAPAGGLTVTLASDKSAATVPQTLTIPGGQYVGAFMVNTSTVGAVVQATISASSGGVTVAALLTVLPAADLVSIAVTPSAVVGGSNAGGTVTLSAPAPAGGTVVALASDRPEAIVPPSVTVYTGATVGYFTVQTMSVSTVRTATLTASRNGITKTATLTVNPAALSALYVYPSQVVGGSTGTGSIYLTGPAPPGGLVVALSSDRLEATVPATVTIAAGQTSVNFTINTAPVTAVVTANLTASLNGATKTAALTIFPAALQSVTLNPTSVPGGMSATGTVTLTGPAPSGGLVLGLSSDRSEATVPATVAVAAGQTSATFTVNTTPVQTVTRALITGVLNGVSRSAQLTITAVGLIDLRLNPARLVGGGSGTGTVTLSGDAPVGGVTVSLSANDRSVAVPATISVPAGQRSVDFTFNTYPVTLLTTVTITASAGDQTKTATLILYPLAAPTNLTATSVSPTEIDLAWTAAAGATGYKLERQRKGSTRWKQIAVTTNVNYADNALPSGTTYLYRVRASNGIGDSDYSNVAMATTGAVAPATPKNLQARARDGQVFLRWDSVLGAAGYNVKRSNTTGGPYTVVGANIPTNYGNDTGLTNGTTYYYVVSALNDAGESPDSGEVAAGPGAIDGAAPFGGLVQGADGNLYGTTTSGGEFGAGTLFALTPAGDYFATLYSFSRGDSRSVNRDGIQPTSGLLQTLDGTFFGTASSGGGNGSGVIYKLGVDGIQAPVYAFSGTDILGTNGDGAQPFGPLTIGPDGALYGTTTVGGRYARGTVFRITAGGQFTSLYAFNGADGAEPYGRLLSAPDGNLYGTTSQGGDNNTGTLFKITPSGTLTRLYAFPQMDDNTLGAVPFAGLTLGPDGNYYGVTTTGNSFPPADISGPYDNGVIFKMTPAGVVSQAYAFSYSDGIAPYGELVLGADGALYGVTSGGGANNNGTVFRYNPTGGFSVLYAFSDLDGRAAHAPLMPGADGSLYGATVSGGPFGSGTVFSVTPSGQFTVLYAFSHAVGLLPMYP